MPFLKPKGSARRGLVYMATPATHEADAPRYTRRAEAQDIYGKARPVKVERVAPEDLTLVAGVPSEAVAPLVWGRMTTEDPVLAEAVQAWKAGDWEPSPLPTE